MDPNEIQSALALLAKLADSDLAKEAYREDGGKEAARETFAGLADLAWLIRRPFRYLRQAWEWTDSMVAELHSRLAAEERADPPLELLGAIADGRKYLPPGHPLSEMFEELLRSACDRQRAEDAHPAFADIIRQLSPDEALLVWGLANLDGWFWRSERAPRHRHERPRPWVPVSMKHVGATHKAPEGTLPWLVRRLNRADLITVYIDHLVSLNLCRVQKDPPSGKPAMQDNYVTLSSFGALFARACAPSDGFSWYLAGLQDDVPLPEE